MKKSWCFFNLFSISQALILLVFYRSSQFESNKAKLLWCFSGWHKPRIGLLCFTDQKIQKRPLGWFPFHIKNPKLQCIKWCISDKTCPAVTNWLSKLWSNRSSDVYLKCKYFSLWSCWFFVLHWELAELIYLYFFPVLSYLFPPKVTHHHCFVSIGCSSDIHQ